MRREASLFLLVPLLVAAQSAPRSEADPDSSSTVATLRKEIAIRGDAALTAFWTRIEKSGAPLIERVPGSDEVSFVTFLWRGDSGTRNVVIFDGVAGFDARDRMIQLEHTNLWYKTYRVRNDARFAYNLSPNDSLVSLNSISDDAEMETRLASFRVDPLNPHRCPGTFNHGESSYVELAGARPSVLGHTPLEFRGSTNAKAFASHILKSERKLWIYTPPGYPEISHRAPLLVFFDGDRNIDWIPRVLDALIYDKSIPRSVAVLIENPSKALRNIDLPCSERFSDFLATELVPWMRANYNVSSDPRQTIAIGSSYGGLAATFASLRHPEIFGGVISLSGSFWWKPAHEQEPEWLTQQFVPAKKTDTRFYLEVGLMEDPAMQIATNRHMRDVLLAKGSQVGYREYNGGHALLNCNVRTAEGCSFQIGRSSAVAGTRKHLTEQ